MRIFSVQEANSFVPALQSAFGDIERLRHRVVRLVGELERQGDKPTLDLSTVPDGLPEPVRTKRHEIRDALGEIRRLVQELETHGVIVKQLDGLVDFRSVRGKRPVYLSWRKGEPAIDHWHEVWSEDSLQPVDKFFGKAVLN